MDSILRKREIFKDENLPFVVQPDSAENTPRESTKFGILSAFTLR